ncbi:MAG TPA: energy transducer TonB, partial [Planctomycetaceae bacterium]|nr:energy transducer TonB [Planctomycetaceae bacterium]
IDEQGSVTRVRVEESSGYLLLDAAAVTSIRTWRVKPAQRNGQPVAGSWLLPIRFRQQL